MSAVRGRLLPALKQMIRAVFPAPEMTLLPSAARCSDRTQFFQFIIPKAKMQAENTITLEAEGDPSVFNMSLKVLRPESGEMMQLVQYNLTEN